MSHSQTFNIADFGVVAGDNVDNLANAKSIQAAIDECSKSGGGLVIVPKELHFFSAPFELKSNVNLHLEKGSEIIASPVEKHYIKSAFRDNLREGSIWIGAENAHNIAISGTGIINGNGVAFMGPEVKAAFSLKPFKEFDRRPHMITMIGCQNLTFRDFKLKNSAYWGIHLVGCNNVQIHSLTINNNLKIRNSDGIDLDHCKNVNISNCTIESGDDSICLKNRREYSEFGSCENIHIQNCLMTSTSCAFKIGSENVDKIRDISVKNCKILRSNRGIGVQNRDEGTVENIIFSDIEIESRLFDDTWWGKSEPIYITAFKRASNQEKDANVRFSPGQTEGKVGFVRGIKFINCKCRSENGIFISGEPGKISDICFKIVEISLNKTTNYDGGLYDRRPCAVQGIIKNPTSGFFIDTAENIKLNNCKVIWGRNRPPYYKSALITKNIKNLTLENFEEK